LQSAGRTDLEAAADWKSAIQQIENLRYFGCGEGALRSAKTDGNFSPIRASQKRGYTSS